MTFLKNMRSNATVKYTKASLMGSFYVAAILQFNKNIIICLQIIGRYISAFTTGLQVIFLMRIRILLPW